MKYELIDNMMIIDHEHHYTNKPVSTFFDDYYISSKKRKSYIHNGIVTLNHQKIVSLDKIIQDENIILTLVEEEIDWPLATSPANVVYEDPFLYIVHKDPGCIIHGETNDQTCLNAQAAKYQSIHQIYTPVRPIHRLDKETTGLVLYSKIPFFQPWFDEQLAKKKINRQYYAIGVGKMPKQKQFTCHLPIGKDRHVNNKYRISKTGKDAITHFSYVKHNGKFVLVRCKLETGRTHQIRVHLSHLGLPIVNDTIYGVPSNAFTHMGLWAQEITFINPITHQSQTVHDIPNTDFEKLLHS